MIRGVIFDMDGVMFDTERLAAEGWEQAGRELGYPIPDDLVNRMRGMSREGSRQLFERHFYGERDYERARALRRSYVRDWIARNGLPRKPGLTELLSYLRQTGRKVALATSTDWETADQYLRLAGVEAFFDCRVCGEMVERGKPAPDIFLAAARALNLPPQECAVLEDSAAGLTAAHRACCQPVFVPDLCRVEPQVTALAVRCDSLAQVIQFLERSAPED